MVRRILTNAAFLAVYTGLAMAVQETRLSGGVAFVWVASAFLIAVLLHAPRGRWPELLLLAFAGVVASVGFAGEGWATGPGLALANMGEAWLAAALLRRHGLRGDEVLSDFVAYCAIIALVAPLLGAAVATADTLVVTGRLQLAGGLDYLVAHALGAIIFLPMFTLLVSGDLVRWLRAQTRRSLLELVVVGGIVALCGYAAFSQTRLPLLVLPVLAAMMATYRFDKVGATLSVVLLAAIGSVLTVRGFGPMVLKPGDVAPTVQLLQAYLAVIVLCSQPLARDVARRQRLDLELREARALYELLAENTSDIVLKTNEDGFITYASPAVGRYGDEEPIDLIGRHLTDMIHATHAGAVMALHEAAIAGQPDSQWSECVVSTGDGAEAGSGDRWFEVQIHSLFDDNGRVYGAVSILRNIDERKALEEQLFEAGLTDPLTGLSNRRAFIAMLQYHIDEQAGGCLAMFDLDHFKAINDQYGHAVGDRVLILFGSVARSLVRSEDMVARIGGEKFGVLLPRVSAEQAEVVCSRILSTFSGTTRVVGDAIVRTTASGGVSRIAGSADETMRSADLALYTAKAKGRDRLEMASRPGARRW